MKQGRVARRLTQEQAAEKLGMNRNRYGLLETDKFDATDIRLEEAYRLKALFGVPLDAWMKPEPQEATP